jgi:hypothetical protein
VSRNTTSGHAWPAFYRGRCNQCGRVFEVGTMVRYEQGRIVEDECDSTAPEEAASMGPNERRVYREQMCPKCFTVHAPGQEGCA